MKNILFKAYALIIGQLMSLLLTVYMVIYHLYTYNILLKATKVHLWLQLILSMILIYALYHFIRVIKISSKMRKAAQEQREANSKRVEVLVFTLMMILLFSSLFYTAPYRRYFPTYLEYAVYFYNSFFQLLLLISVVTTHTHVTDKFIKTKQKYAGVGAAFGLVLFYIYVQLIS